MNKLQERVEKMLNGEKKRRDIVKKWLAEVTEILEDAGEDIWGRGVCFGVDVPTYTTDVLKVDKDGKKRETEIYFRYVAHQGRDSTEYPGFYYNGQYNTWGADVEDLRGREFWYCIQCILEWIPIVLEAMEKREISREELLAKINITE